MRVITQTRIKQGMERYPQWRFGLALWLETFRQTTVGFESFQHIRRLWKATSGWNLDRVPSRKVLDTAFKGDFDFYLFDIHGTECRLVTRIQPATNKIFVRGAYSHAEYDKWWRSKVSS